MRYMPLCRLAFTMVACMALLVSGEGFRSAQAQMVSDQLQVSSGAIELVGQLSIMPGASINSLAVQGHYAYIVGGNSLQIVDLSTPTTPTVIGRYEPAVGKYLGDLVVSGDYAYVSSSWSATNSFPYRSFGLSLEVVDIHDPSRPFLKRSLMLQQVDYGRGGFHISAMTATATRVYVTISSQLNIYLPPVGSFMSIDTTDPTAPRLSESIDLGMSCGTPSDMATSGAYALITCQGVRLLPEAPSVDALVVIDTTDVQQPRKVKGLDLGANGVRLTIVNSSAYVVLTTGELVTVDIVDPLQPEILARVDSPSIRAITGTKHVLIVTTNNDMLQVRDRSTFTLVNTYAIAPFSYIEQFSNDMLVVANKNNMLVLRYPSGSSLRGQVVDLLGQGVASVGMRLNDGRELVTDTDGNYLFLSRPDGPFTLTPSKPGVSFLPPVYSGTTPQEDVLPTFTQVAAPITSAILPGQQTQLHMFDPTGFAVTVSLPPDALTEPALLTLAPALEGPGAGGLAPIGHAFDITIAPVLILHTPISVTVRMTAAHTRIIRDTTQIHLLQRVGTSWRNADQSCAQTLPVTDEQFANERQVAICFTGRFVMVGPTHQTLLPTMKHRR